MHQRRMTAGSALIAGLGMLAACSHAKPLPAPITLAPGARIDVASIMGTVKDLKKTATCPITVHYDGSILGVSYSGKVNYRWERSTGVIGATQEVTLAGGTAQAPAVATIQPDEWKIGSDATTRSYTDRIHILWPVDRLGDTVQVMASCK